jgi:hypothetical protein
MAVFYRLMLALLLLAFAAGTGPSVMASGDAMPAAAQTATFMPAECQACGEQAMAAGDACVVLCATMLPASAVPIHRPMHTASQPPRAPDAAVAGLFGAPDPHPPRSSQL